MNFQMSAPTSFPFAPLSNQFEPANPPRDEIDVTAGVLTQTFPEPPHIPGCWLEIGHHFFSNTSSAVLYQSITSALLQNNVDIDIQPLKYKIYCRFVQQGLPNITFAVRIYSNNDGNGNTYVPLEDFVATEILQLTNKAADPAHVDAFAATTSSTIQVAAENLKTVKFAVEFQLRTVSAFYLIGFYFYCF